VRARVYMRRKSAAAVRNICRKATDGTLAAAARLAAVTHGIFSFFFFFFFVWLVAARHQQMGISNYLPGLTHYQNAVLKKKNA